MKSHDALCVISETLGRNPFQSSPVLFFDILMDRDTPINFLVFIATILGVNFKLLNGFNLSYP